MPFDNGAHLFAAGLANEQQLRYSLPRCLRLGITRGRSPTAAPGAGPAGDRCTWQAPDRTDRRTASGWRSGRSSRTTERRRLPEGTRGVEDYRGGGARRPAGPEPDAARCPRRPRARARASSTTRKKRLAAKRQGGGRAPSRLMLPAGGDGLGEHAPAERGRGGERLRLRDGPWRYSRVNREGSGRLEAETSCELAELDRAPCGARAPTGQQDAPTP